MHRKIHEIAIDIRHAQFGKGGIRRPALDVLLKTFQLAGRLIHVVDLDAKVIQTVRALVGHVAQNGQLEIAVGQMKTSGFLKLRRRRTFVDFAKAKGFLIKRDEFLGLLGSYGLMSELVHE